MDVQSWLRKQLEQASPDLLRAMVQEFAEALMGAEVDALCGAPYGERSPERVNIRNGYRERGLGHAGGDDRTRDPEARQGSYFPDWLLQPVGFANSVTPDLQRKLASPVNAQNRQAHDLRGRVRSPFGRKRGPYAALRSSRRSARSREAAATPTP